MDGIFGFLGAVMHSWITIVIIGVVLVALGGKYLLRLLGIWLIPEDSIGVVEKKFVLFAKDKTLPDGRIVALNGEAGLQADTLPPGLKFFLWPWQFKVSIIEFTVIPQGQVGIVEAMDGNAIPAGRILARKVNCDSYQNARAFLANNGERGTQIEVVPPGTYRINTRLFTVKMVPAISIPDNMVGVVTTKEGHPLATGEIAGRKVEGHNSFQDGDAFVNGGGFKGQQEEVILAGTYYLNPQFVAVVSVPMTEVPIGHVGVVVSYVGETVQGENEEFKHGKLVEKGQKGVWRNPFDPGMYAVNPLTMKVVLVPTTNIVLNWADAKSSSHELDTNLCTITARSSDGFTYNLDVSQIIHVSRDAASAVIARFGSMDNLVSQVLEPLIGNYFRNSAQKHDAIAFLTERADRQSDAKSHIQEALQGHYDVQAVDTLIGDIVPPPELMKTLSDLKIAERLKDTYEAQKLSEDARKELENAKATANTQETVVTAQRQVEIRTFEAEAAIAQAKGVAAAKETNATADAMVLRTVGEAEAGKTLAVGGAEAKVLTQKVESVGSSAYATMAIAEFVVPKSMPRILA
ncbi:MAG: SPFH domain-containing protein, partial [Patescibacteria group bacterium]